MALSSAPWGLQQRAQNGVQGSRAEAGRPVRMLVWTKQEMDGDDLIRTVVMGIKNHGQVRFRKYFGGRANWILQHIEFERQEKGWKGLKMPSRILA